MTLDQLRYFCAAASLQHIGHAAKQEHISQPSLSIALRKLEEELGVPLFVNAGRGIALTEEGVEFSQYASAILQQTATAVARMQAHAGRMNTEIHMAYTSSVASAFIPQLFHDFLEQTDTHPLIFSDEMPSAGILSGIHEGRYDLGICSQETNDPEFCQMPLLFQHLVLILPENPIMRGHSILQPQSRAADGGLPADTALDFSTPDQLNGLSFISYRSSFPMYVLVSQLLERFRVHPLISHYAYSEDAIARFAEQALGVSIAAETESLKNFRIRILRPSWLSGEGRYIYLTWHKHRPLGLASMRMMEFIKQRAQPETFPAGVNGCVPVSAQAQR